MLKTSPQFTERLFTNAEREELERARSMTPHARRWRTAVENTFVMWSIIMVGVVIVWLILAWVVRKFSGTDFGLHSPAAPWIVEISAPTVFLIAITSTIRWLRKWKNFLQSLNQDILNKKVLEERYRFDAAKRFQEPEYGGLIYFLHTVDDKVLALFDRESQDLGAHGHDAMTSKFSPQTELVLIRAPLSRIALGKQFSGTVIDAGSVIELTVQPNQWPEQDEFCDIDWSELENHYSKVTH